MYEYYQGSYAARERIDKRRREADAERIIRQARARRHRRRRAQLAEALGLIAGRRAARLRPSA